MSADVPPAAPLTAFDRWWSGSSADPLVLHARKAVSAADPYLQGHFPGFPLYPGTFVLETLSQLMRAGLPGPAVRLRSIAALRLVAPLLAGDELAVEATARRGHDAAWHVTATGTRRDGSTCATLRAAYAADGSSDPDRGEGVLDHAEVRAQLPQRFPLMLVDRVLELRPPDSITTVKAVTANEPCYAELPDGAPSACFAYPVSLIIESLGQSAALLWQRSMSGPDESRSGRHPLFLTARGYEVTGEAYPGDVVRHVVRLDQIVAGTGVAHGESWVGGHRIARVETLMAAHRSGTQLRAGRTRTGASTPR